MKSSFKFVLALPFFAATAFGAVSDYMHQPYISTRVMGMGGAFTALADDYNALYYNAAGLARLHKSELNLELQVGGSPSILTLYNSISAAGSNPNALTNVLQSNYGSHYSSRVILGGTYVWPDWGFGFIPLDFTVEADITALEAAAVGLEAYQDSTIQLGRAWNIGDAHRFSIGIAPKAVYRAFIDKTIYAIDLISNSGSLVKLSDANEGLTFDADLGALYIFKAPEGGWFGCQSCVFSAGAAIRNVVDEGFPVDEHLYSGQSLPIQETIGNMNRRFDVGTRFDLPDVFIFHPRLVVDGRDMGSPLANTKKCLHAGAELLWEASESIHGAYRFGISEGYLTGGLSVSLSALSIDIATYSEDIGTIGAPEESRRYMAQLSADF
ncbi:unnamed protein product [Sphagnum balticum]